MGRITHGMTGTKEYVTWKDMKRRCLDESFSEYHLYGGRGITFAKRWLIFANFLKDLGKCPSKKHTLERINSNKGYFPSNCKWATTTEQARNRKNNVYLTYLGKRLIVEDWARKIGITSNSLRKRLKRWKDPSKVFKKGPQKRKIIKITYQNKTLSIAEWSTITGISRANIYRKYMCKFPLKSILTLQRKHGKENTRKDPFSITNIPT